MSQALVITFAASKGKWRVVDTCRPGKERFAVMAWPDNFNMPENDEDRAKFEIELCSFQYRPHAEAVAALPELAYAIAGGRDVLERRAKGKRKVSALEKVALDMIVAAMAKAEGKVAG